VTEDQEVGEAWKAATGAMGLLHDQVTGWVVRQPARLG
jgi:hypothetical protein